MGSGHNESLSVSRGARGRASTRTAIHFWLDVPLYEYELQCGVNGDHTFLSRNPVLARTNDEGFPIEDFCVVWCDRCQEFRVIDSPEPEPSNLVALEKIAHRMKKIVTSLDDAMGFEQDKGILRERIAQEIQDRGYLTTDAEITDLAVEFGVPVGEIKKLNAGLKAPDIVAGQPDMCQAGLHEMTVDNIAITRGRRQCKACRAIAQKKRRAANR
jgi:LysM domain-containing protein